VKKNMLIGVLFMVANLFAQHVVIFDKGEVCYLGTDSAACKPADQKKSAFLQGFKSDIEKPVSYESEFNFDAPPLQWGKRVHDFRLGRAAYHTSFEGGFVADLWLNNLLPNHNYVLCLNGKPDLVGNDLLPEPVPGNPIEKYLDFLTIKTDANGEYHAKLGVMLKPGAYHVRFYVKDDDDKIIILYHDYFKFTVK
jgi:hypothetical protein